MSASAGVTGSGTECDGEEQEDPSSSNTNESLEENFDGLSLQDGQNGDDALSAFRQQWQRELSSPQRTPGKLVPKDCKEPDDEEEKAKMLFLRGVELERCGQWYEAVQHYKRAVQILPDVEIKLYQNTEMRHDTPEAGPDEEPVDASKIQNSDAQAEEDEEGDSEDGDLFARFQRILENKGRLIEPELPHKNGHLSWLPYEVLLMLLRWVVSSELDALSLESVAAVCRGLYIAAHDDDLWRALCARTWGLNCGTPKVYGFSTWREMYVERPRLRLHGCYISKTTYLRHGENSFQDQFYKPWYLVEYYRYLRFFAEGVALLWTTSEAPAACVPLLRLRLAPAHAAVLSGHYRLVGDKVVLIMKKAPIDKKPAQPSNTRFRARRKENAPHDQGQTYQLELQLKSIHNHHNWQLSWCGYRGRNDRDSPDHWTNFDINPNKFPPFNFSRVKHYMAEAEAPLA